MKIIHINDPAGGTKIDRQAARSLARETPLRELMQSAAELREAVTSPGGTTAAALEEMERRGMPSIIADAVKAARDRGVELDG